MRTLKCWPTQVTPPPSQRTASQARPLRKSRREPANKGNKINSMHGITPDWNMDESGFSQSLALQPLARFDQCLGFASKSTHELTKRGAQRTGPADAIVSSAMPSVRRCCLHGPRKQYIAPPLPTRRRRTAAHFQIVLSLQASRNSDENPSCLSLTRHVNSSCCPPWGLIMSTGSTAPAVLAARTASFRRDSQNPSQLLYDTVISLLPPELIPMSAAALNHYGASTVGGRKIFCCILRRSCAGVMRQHAAAGLLTTSAISRRKWRSAVPYWRNPADCRCV